MVKKLVEYCLMDPDLGIPTRFYWKVLGKRELEISRRLGVPLSVLFVDVDGLKEINDTYGHPAGDIYLRKVVEVLRAFVRSSDLIIRWGGDEFVILLHTDERGAELVKERIYRVMEKTCVEIGAKRIKPSVSIGVAEVKDSFLDAVVLADARMYGEKRLRKLHS